MRRRTGEIGLRMALGAHPSRVARLIAGQVTAEIAVGLAAGGALAVALARASRAMLFHVQPGDPATCAAIVATLTLAAAAAAWRQVRRAIRVDPVVALRDEQGPAGSGLPVRPRPRMAERALIGSHNVAIIAL